MISAFESMVRTSPNRVCFTFVDKQGKTERYTFKQTRLIAASLARKLQSLGVHRGDCVLIDLPNCPEFVFLMLACAYGSFTLVPLNNRLTLLEKQSRQHELERTDRTKVAVYVDGLKAKRLLRQAKADLEGTNRTRIILSAQRDAEEEAIHYAERQAHLFDEGDCALVMFTSGTTGKPKAVALTWRQLLSSARLSNASLNREVGSVWQAALPLYHIGGAQIVIRSILNKTPFMLYERFDARRILSDALVAGATHLSVVDKMLQDLLAVDNQGALANYQCILLGGGALNHATLDAAVSAGARVYASYGMTETASHVAHELVTQAFDGGLQLMGGYIARIVDADGQGFGRLALKGPGLFSGYLNAHAAFTIDGFFLTGDTAALRGGKIYVKERTDDMFVSGGENVYPAEIADKLKSVAGVTDAYVFGAPDAKWGRRPVAFIERAASTTPTRAASTTPTRAESPTPVEAGRSKNTDSAHTNSREFSAYVHESLKSQLSKLYMPRNLFTLENFPRTGIGKIDRAAIQDIYNQRIEIKRITLYLVHIPFKSPFKTAKATLDYRESLLVEVCDHAGRTGLGECAAFATDWYLPETIEQDVRLLREIIGPKVLAEVYLHPREVTASFADMPEVATFPLALGALEPALWDLYGKIIKKPLWQLIAEEANLPVSAAEAPATPATTATPATSAASAGSAIPTSSTAPATSSGSPSVQPSHDRVISAGAVVGMGTPTETVETVRRCVEAGYKRVKLKIAPGALACVQEVRAVFPHLMLTLDANQSFTEHDMAELRALDACGAAWIEEPLDLSRISQRGGKSAVYAQLARLQRALSTPICLDESFSCAAEAYEALEHPELRCFAIKIGKFGGVSGALNFVRTAQTRGARVWMGGMYDTGISKRLHAAFQMLPGIDVPGDIGATSRYFSTDVCDPPYEVTRGNVTLNIEGNTYGLGCVLCRPALANVQVNQFDIA